MSLLVGLSRGSEFWRLLSLSGAALAGSYLLLIDRDIRAHREHLKTVV
jgi:hypothetical protein